MATTLAVLFSVHTYAHHDVSTRLFSSSVTQSGHRGHLDLPQSVTQQLWLTAGGLYLHFVTYRHACSSVHWCRGRKLVGRLEGSSVVSQASASAAAAGRYCSM